ncbi:short-chain dehydrogenase/reductase SDR [Hyaloraphidium curvatum]|nr:short-chain dehydrogenase/reductase SDR [Hyaloraphidium curvatum]
MPDFPKKWTAADLPNLAGRRVVVTGANSGLGLGTATELARKGAAVWLACRSVEKGEEAAKKIREQVPGADVRVAPPLDLGDLESVKRFAEAVGKEWGKLDVLCNNAGVMAIPERKLTKEGFEMQFGTNHLGHFALTAHLWPYLKAADAPRVVNVSSMMANYSPRFDFSNLPDWKSGYGAQVAYSYSKLANLLFSHELQRRADAAEGGRSKVTVVSAHPGYTSTNLQFTGPEATSGFKRYVMGAMNGLFAQDVSMGILPQLLACAAKEAPRDGYVGPAGLTGMGGYPGIVTEPKLAADTGMAKELWEKSEQWTKTKFDF